jgi:TatD DNase family protein
MTAAWIDTHAHLNDVQFDADRDLVLQRARDAGVETFIEVAESSEMWDKAIALAEKYPTVYASLGIHPHHAHLVTPDEWRTLGARLRQLARHPKVVAIGEFGLDYFRMQNTKEQQLFILRAQLEIARDLQKPIVIHCREASPIPPDFRCHADLQHILNEFYPATALGWTLAKPVGVIHCFSGTWEDAQFYMARGFMLGVDGPVTYPSAKLLQDNVRRIPVERLVLETDSPYLPPQTHRGQRNESGYLPSIGIAVGDLKHQSTEAFAAQTTANARALFRISQ